MIHNIPKVPVPTSPLLLDKPISELQTILKSNLSWLDYSFGRCQRLIKTKDKRDYYYPAVYISNNNYVNVLPDQQLGNFSFIWVDDPLEIAFNPNTFNKVNARISLIFWINLDSIYTGSSDRNTENLKAEILGVLTRKQFLNSGRISWSTIYERSENIYKGFSLLEIESQYLMAPYAGFRFEGSILMEESCSI